MSEQVADVPAQAGEAPSDNWRDALSPELTTDPSLQHIGSVEAMAKSYINAQKMVGADKVPVPGNWATDEDWALVYNKLGRPEKPDGYELEETGEFSDWFRGAAHGAGLSDRQAQQLAAAYGEFNGEASAQTQEQIDSRRSEIETEMRQEFGGQYDMKMERANALLKEFNAPDLTEMLMADGTSLGDSPDLIRFMVNMSDYIAEQVSEDGLAGRDSRPTLSDGDIQNRVSELTAKNSPYWEKMHPDHDRVVAEVLQLREQIFG